MSDESDYDSAAEADTGPMPVPVDMLEQQDRLQLIFGQPLPTAPAADATVSPPAPSAAVVTVPGAPVPIAVKVLRGGWSVLKPNNDGPGSQ